MCENNECDYPFGYEDLEFVKQDETFASDDELESIAISRPTSSGSVISTAAWSDIDKLNKAYDSEDQCDIPIPRSDADRDAKLQEMLKQKEAELQTKKNLQDIKKLNVQPPVEKPIVWVLGGPGVGKGTQCDKIVAKYGFTHLSTGDLLRAEVSSGSERGKKLAEIMTRGGLVPNEVVLELLKDAIEKNKANSKGFLIDGYPREKSQGEAFERTIAPCSMILYFEASSDTMKKRLVGRAAASKEQRADDNEQTIQIRLKTFLDNNAQVLAQYPHKFKAINAERPIRDVFHDVVNVFDPIMSLQRA